MSAVEQALARVVTDRRDGIGWITFDNQARRNAMTLDMWRQLDATARELDEDKAVRVVVIRGAGEKAFVSGGDISEFSKNRSNAEQKAAYSRVATGAQDALKRLRKPLIAMIRGYCLGGGLGIALTADVRIASNRAQFGIPAAKLGSGYEYEHTATLARLIGASSTKDLLFSARQIDTQEALRIGLINIAVEDNALEEAVREYAGRLAANAPLTLEAAKLAIRQFERLSTVASDADVSSLIERCFNSRDYKEGWSAFMEKRAPQFTGE